MKFNRQLQQCVNAIIRGEVIAYPTEAIWGLGCDPWNSHAVSHLLKLKKRPIEKGLILVAGELEQVAFLLRLLTQQQRDTVMATWPGHTTWLLPHAGLVPGFVSGYRDTVAVRVSTHPIIKALCKAVDGPIVSTSANPTGSAPARHRLGAKRYYSALGVPLAPGKVGNARSPSTIRDLKTGTVIRK